MRVALLTPGLPPERAWSETIVPGVASGLVANGQRPRLITSHPAPPRTTLEDGVEVVRVWRPPTSRFRRRGWDDYVAHAPFSYLALTRSKPDIAHADYHVDAAAAARWSERSGRPAVFTYTGVPDHAGLTERRFRLEFVQRALAGSAAVVALSDWARDAFLRDLGVEAKVIHPGTDLRLFIPAAEQAEEPTVFCPAAPDNGRARTDLVLAAFRRMRRDRPEARLRLPRPASESLARELDESAEGVSLVDPAGERAAEYAGAWITALASVRLPFAGALVESMACGTPVVGGKRESLLEIVNGDAVGRLFDDEGGEEGLARALLEAFELAEDPATRDACRTRAEHFSTERATDQYLDLYTHLLEERSP